MVKNSRLMGQEELVLQTSPEENGKAALAMILACFGKTVTMEELGGPIHNAAELVSAAQEQGLAARGLRMTVEEVEKAPLPLIAHWRFRAFVVVTKVKGNRVWISSPEEGFLTLSRKEFQQGFTGVALCFALPGEGTPESSGGDSDGEKDKKPSAVQKPARKKAEKEEGGLKGMLPPAAWALLGVIQLFIAAGYGLLAILCRRLAMGLSAPQQVHGVGLCLFIAGLLLALGGVTIFIFVERFMAIRKASVLDMNFMNRIRDYISDGKISTAVNLCKKTDTPIARMIEKGIERIGRPMSDVQTAIENVANLEVSKLENGLPFLATIAGGAPMIGFLGTVLGMVQTFMDMSAAGGTVDLGLLSSGMYVAMVTTVMGLIVGIPAYFGYNYLVARIEKLVFQMEANSIAFMDILNQPVQK